MKLTATNCQRSPRFGLRPHRGTRVSEGRQLIAEPFLRHDVAYQSCLPRKGGVSMGRPPVPPGEPTGLNQERPGQRTEARCWAGSQPRGRRPPGSHNPGDGQVVGMVNTCEPAIKTVSAQRAKVAVLRETARAKRQRGSECGFNGAASWMIHPPVDSRYLSPHMLRKRNVETPYASRRCASPTGEGAARGSDRCAGLGCRKKPMPRCNGADTGPRGRARKRAHVRPVFRCERI